MLTLVGRGSELDVCLLIPQAGKALGRGSRQRRHTTLIGLYPAKRGRDDLEGEYIVHFYNGYQYLVFRKIYEAMEVRSLRPS